MKTHRYIFHWLDGKANESTGTNPREAYEKILSRKPLKKLAKIEISV